MYLLKLGYIPKNSEGSACWDVMVHNIKINISHSGHFGWSNTGLTNNISYNVWSSSRVLLFCMLADWQGLQGHFSVQLQLLVTPVLFLLWHVEMCAVKKAY